MTTPNTIIADLQADNELLRTQVAVLMTENERLRDDSQRCPRCMKFVAEGHVHTCTPTDAWHALEIANYRLKTRCYPSRVVMIDGAGHYVSEAVGERVDALVAYLQSVDDHLRIIPTYTTEQARQLMTLQDKAKALLSKGD